MWYKYTPTYNIYEILYPQFNNYTIKKTKPGHAFSDVQYTTWQQCMIRGVYRHIAHWKCKYYVAYVNREHFMKRYLNLQKADKIMKPF